MEATEGKMIYVINDHEKIANKHADKKQVLLHAGQSDVVKNPQTRFGRSTHNIAEVERAMKETPAPEYLGFGAMFPSPTKSDVAVNQAELAQVMNLWKNDLVLIGGITLGKYCVLAKGRTYLLWHFE